MCAAAAIEKFKTVGVVVVAQLKKSSQPAVAVGVSEVVVVVTGEDLGSRRQNLVRHSRQEVQVFIQCHIGGG